MDERDTTLLSTWSSLGDAADVFRLFSRPTSPGYVVLGCWATRVSQQYIKSAAVIKNWGSSTVPLPVVVVNEAMSREIIHDCLLYHGVAVEMYERTNSGSGGYQVTRKGTPGNIADFEATLFEFSDTEVSLISCGAVSFRLHSGGGGGNQVRVGFASLNTTLRTITISEFDDVVQLVNLESHVAQTGLKELVYSPQAFGTESDLGVSISRLCERANVAAKPVGGSAAGKKGAAGHGAPSSSVVDVQRRIADLLRVPEEKMLLVDQPLSAQAVGYLLDRAALTDVSDRGQFSLKVLTASTFLKLDASAIEALNIVALHPHERARGKLPTTIFDWLNRCLTGMGSRMMRQWLLQPLRDVLSIQERHSILEAFVEDPLLRDSVANDVLRRCGDLDRLNRKLQRRTAPLKELYALRGFVDAVAAAVGCCKRYSGQHTKTLSGVLGAPLESCAEQLVNLRTLVEYTIDVADREARIKPEFDDDLTELEDQRKGVLKQIDQEFGSAMKRYGWSDKQLKCELHPSYGYVFRVTRKDDQQLREQAKHFVVISTAKDGVRFCTERLSSLSEQHRQINKSYQTRQFELKTKLVETVATYLPVLDESKELIAQLDVFVAWARVVKDSKRAMVRPTMVTAATVARTLDAEEPREAAILNLVNLRHPLVELRQETYTPNSVKLSSQQPRVNALIITGPNMGGKSTFMRSVGVAAVMAQAGCFVCADHAEVAVRDAVMCRVGATDHLSQGVSTFMVEMLESAAILSTATSQSLVIVDELGRGTSTYDGFGLAWAIADFIANNIGAALLFSTHFHEMTDLEAASSGGNVRNVHFGAEPTESGALRFTYRLAPGACERSYGIYVAQIAKLPEAVVREAKQKADELESFAGKTEKWRHVELDEGAHQRMQQYIQTLRDASKMEDIPALNALRAAILSDERVSMILSESS